LVLANEAPWAGFNGSGYGRDLSIYALDDYSRTKHVMHNHNRAMSAVAKTTRLSGRVKLS
jgi:hypothetical protein